MMDEWVDKLHGLFKEIGIDAADMADQPTEWDWVREATQPENALFIERSGLITKPEGLVFPAKHLVPMLFDRPWKHSSGKYWMNALSDTPKLKSDIPLRRPSALAQIATSILYQMPAPVDQLVGSPIYLVILRDDYFKERCVRHDPLNPKFIQVEITLTWKMYNPRQTSDGYHLGPE